MNVIKRNGDIEEVSFDKVLNRIRILSNDLKVDFFDIAQKVCTRIYNNVKTSELDELAAHICSSLIIDNPDYGVLASRISISNHQKNTSPSFSETCYILYTNKDIHGVPNPLISDELYDIVMKNKEKINNYIDYTRDFLFDYFGFKTLEKAYLIKVNDKIIERPQHMIMRVAIGIHGKDLKDALQTYDLISKKYFTHATPTLFNSGTSRPQLSSCFLLSINSDSISGIYDSLKECAEISKHSGGIGIHIHDVRSKGSLIRGTNGKSDGIGPMLKVFNHTARYVNQCVTPDKLVYTNNGIKRMDQVSTEDYLVTHDGSFKKVNSISINDKVCDELIVIDVKHAMYPIKCTKVHEILVIDTQNDNIDNFTLLKSLKDGKIKEEYIPAEKVTKNHVLVFPIPEYSNDISEISEDDMRIYGILIKNGSINIRSEWCINTENVPLEYIKLYLQNKKIEYGEYSDKGINYINLYYNKNTSLPFKIDDIYYNNEQYIHPKYLHLSITKIAMLLKGLLEVGGYSGLDGIFYNSTSENILQSMKYMLLRLGILVTITNNELKIPKIQRLKDLNIYDNFVNTTKLQYLQYNNWLLSKVINVSKMSYTGKVYDFNMIDNHNYLTDSGLIHNSGKRSGSFAVYLEPWHADVFEFLDLKKPQGNEEDRARDLFYALWVPDLFMERVKNNGKWSLMCPDQCRGLSDCYGEKFKELYESYESKGMFTKQIEAQQLWFKILELQMESGVPYILYKDACNIKSNQKNLGTIKSSNLCTEIIEYSSPEEIAVCNLASVCLSSFVEIKEKPEFNFEKLHEITMIMTKNLNKVIDVNYYPLEKARRSNLKHRPIGLGVQGLADTFILMRYPFESAEAKELNRLIFETIYHAAVEQSMKIAKTRYEIISQSGETDYNLNLNEFDPISTSKYPGAYSTFDGSPASIGELQFDLWNVKPTENRYNWDILKKNIIKYGMRNSLLVAPMPTASTSQIMGLNECLHENTTISDIHGLSKKIKNFYNMKVNGFNELNKTIEISDSIKLINQGFKKTLKLTFNDGREIICTDNHKFLSDKNKWIEAKNLTNNINIVASIQGIIDNEDEEKDIKYEKIFGSFVFNMNTNENRDKFHAFVRILGYCLSDGHIETKNNSCALYVGCIYDVELIKYDLILLDEIPYIYENKNAIKVSIHKQLSDAIYDAIKSKGKKINGNINIPVFLKDKDCPKSLIREFLGAHFGGDGVAPFLKYDKRQSIPNLSYPYLIHAYKNEYKAVMKDFMTDIAQLLDIFNIKTRLCELKCKSPYKEEQDLIFRLFIENVSKIDYVNKIGFRYCIQKMLRNDLAQMYWNYEKKIIDQKYTILEEIKELTIDNKINKAEALRQIKEKYNDKVLSKYSIPEYDIVKYFCRGKDKKINYIRPLNPEEFFKRHNCLNWFNIKLNNYINDKHNIDIPYYHISLFKKEDYKISHVYDISVDKNHSFLANGIMVHNCFEPITTNIYKRKTMAGEFILVNKYLVNDLIKLNLWSKDMKNRIIMTEGSIQEIQEIPSDIKELYKTVWEIKQKVLIELAADRGAYIDQSQSLNLFMADPDFQKLTSMHFYSWKLGLKTGIYYLRSKPKAKQQKFAQDITKPSLPTPQPVECMMCSS